MDILQFAYKNVTTKEGTLSATCKLCLFKPKTINVKTKYKSMHNFIRHVRDKHSFKFNEWKASKEIMVKDSNIINSNLEQSEFDNTIQIDDGKIQGLEGTENESDVKKCCKVKHQENEVTEDDLPKYILKTLEKDEKSNGDANKTLNREHFHSQTSKRTGQLRLNNDCDCCSRLKILQEIVKQYADSAKSKCNHIEKERCCCKKMQIDFLQQNPQLSETELDQSLLTDIDLSKSDAEQHITYRFDHKSGEIKYYCTLCIKYGITNAKGGDAGNWQNGMLIKNSKYKNRYVKRHLESAVHIESLNRSKFNDLQQIRKGMPTVNDQATATKNLLTTVQFMASNCLPYRLITYIATLLSLISPNNAPNPIGNRHHCSNSPQKLLKACYESVKDDMKNLFKSDSSITKRKRLVSIAADKGTAWRDATRQAIVALYVADDGMPKEQLLACSITRSGNAESTKKHLKETISEFMSPGQVAFISTDSAAYYIGTNTGMVKQLKDDPSFDKLFWLPDFCHKMENLLTDVRPKWLDQALENCRSICNFVTDHSVVKTEIHNFVDVVKGCIFRVIPTLPSTRFAEYLSMQTNSILTNVKVLLEALPSLVDNRTLGNKTIGIINLISSSSFLARLMLITPVYEAVSALEKKAQKVSFGPFEFRAVIDEFRKNLQQLSVIPEEIQDLLNTNEFSYNTKFASAIHITVDLNETHKRLSHRVKPEIDENVFHDYLQWINNIEKRLDHYLWIPEVVVAGTNAFCINPIDDQIVYACKFANMTNYEHQKCSINCKEVDCNCFEKQYSTFMALFRKKFKFSCENFLKDRENCQFNYVEAFSTFLQNKNFEISTNIYRLLELMQLMKPSQSSTERVMSQISKTVDSRFETKYQFKDIDDMVNIETFCRVNSNIIHLNKENARSHFLSSNHKDALKRNAKLTEQSSSVINFLSELKKGKKEYEKSKKTVETGKTTKKRARENEARDTSTKKIKLTDFESFGKAKNRQNIHISSPRKPDSDFPERDIPEFTITNSDSPELEVSEIEISAISDVEKDTKKKDEEKCFVGKSKRKEMYCTCNKEGARLAMIGCDNEIKCISYLKRLTEEGMVGGDWFHIKCVGLRKRPGKKDQWFCPLCMNCSSSINKQQSHKSIFDLLSSEGKSIVHIRGDGNCLYRALSYVLYKTENKHHSVRQLISATMIEVIQEECNKQLNLKYWRELKEKNDREHLLKAICMITCAKNKEELMNIARRIAIPATDEDSNKSRLEKYGGTLDLFIFSYITKNIIYTLQNYEDEAFRWQIVATPRKMTPEETESFDNFITLKYKYSTVSESLNHYDVIICTEKIPPKLNIIYKNGSICKIENVGMITLD